METTRRTMLAASGGLLIPSTIPARPRRPKRVAGVATVYSHNSHADLILSRLFQTEELDGMGRHPDMELASLYVEQIGPNDLSREFSRRYGIPVFQTIQEALTLGGRDLAVDGVLLIGEHGDYPQNAKGQDLYPRKRFFDATQDVFRQSSRVAPVFSDKHLSHSWVEANDIYTSAKLNGIPLMAGSSVPLTWRRPPMELPRDAHLEEAVAVSYHTLYGYGFHALELLQSVVERRNGGEVGVRAVQCLEGQAVWQAGRQGRYDRSLLDAALSRLSRGAPANMEQAVPQPVVFLIEYRDGFRASVFTLNPVVGEWALAWREHNVRLPKATLFWTQEARPFGHFTLLLRGIESMMHSGRPAWPVERTLLTSGLMDALLTSRQQGGKQVVTPELAIRYRPGPAWKDPGPPPPGRPLTGQ